MFLASFDDELFKLASALRPTAQERFYSSTKMSSYQRKKRREQRKRNNLRELAKTAAYTESGQFTHDGGRYDLGKALSLADKRRTQSFKVSSLNWVLKHDKPNIGRQASADLSAPLLIATDSQGRPTVVDGLHRLAKAQLLGVSTLPGRQLTGADLAKVMVKQAKAKTASPSAVIVMGNPKYVAGNAQADNFYKKLGKFVESKGYSVSFDPGKAYTSPKKADLWIGHSMGVDRIQGAPSGTVAIAMGVQEPNAILHPRDRPVPGKTPTKYHYMLTKKMRSDIEQRLTKTSSILDLAHMAANRTVAKSVGLQTPGMMLSERIREGVGLEDRKPEKKKKKDKTPKQIAKETDKALTEAEVSAALQKRAYPHVLAHVRNLVKKAGACKRTTTIDGLCMKLEVDKGDTRFKGKPHERVMHDSYGYMPGTFGKGADGEAIDIYVNPELSKGDAIGDVFKVRQLKKGTGEFDEDKFMVGYSSGADAKKAFLRNMPGWAFGSMTSMSKKKFCTLVGQKHRS